MGLLKSSVLVFIVATILVGHIPPAKAGSLPSTLPDEEVNGEIDDNLQQSVLDFLNSIYGQVTGQNQMSGLALYLSRLNARLNDATARIQALERQSCEAGFVNYTVCPRSDSLFGPLTDCNLQLFQDDDEIIIDIPVSFGVNFVNEAPAVAVALSGVDFVHGKDCELDVVNVTEDGFTLRAKLEGLLPFSLHASWIACP